MFALFSEIRCIYQLQWHEIMLKLHLIHIRFNSSNLIQELHWLPTEYKISFKITNITFNTLYPVTHLIPSAVTSRLTKNKPSLPPSHLLQRLIFDFCQLLRVIFNLFICVLTKCICFHVKILSLL